MSPDAGRTSPSRVVAVIVGLVLVAGIAGARVRSKQAAAGVDAPLAAPRHMLAPPSSPTPTTRPAGPIDVPNDSYAPEDIRLLGRLEIPKLRVVEPLYDGVTLRNIDLGPSHWPGTALPGRAGNVVVAGHRVTHSHPFLHIDQLLAGDQVIFVVGGVRSIYTVTGHEIVLPDAMWIARQTPTSTATLFACHPPQSADYRYVVRLVLSSS